MNQILASLLSGFLCDLSWEKSPCDSIGGTVKRVSGNASLRSLQEPINTLLKMFECCGKCISAIDIFDIVVYHK